MERFQGGDLAIISSNSLVPQKVENRATLPPGNCTTRDLPQRYKYCDPKGHSTPMFIATLAKLWKEPRCPSTMEWIKKMWYIYTMEYYTAIKNEILSLATMWMELEGTILSEISQSEKDNYHMILLICEFKKQNRGS